MRLLWLIFPVLVLAGCAKHTTPCTYELPSDYIGWVLIEYDKDGAPELPVVGGRRIVRIEHAGHLATSSTQEFGITSDEFVYIGSDRMQLQQTSWGGGGRVWARSTGSMQVTGKPQRLFEVFFIGSESQYKEHASHEPTPEALPNQALEPTTPAVTIPAAQEVAPAGVVAHL